ncbi:MAG: hypothetical protein AB7E55_08455 [Pigmentiphaga sp.]
MQEDGGASTTGVFGWLGNALGSVIRFIVEALQGVFGGLSSAVNSFLSGLADAVGMSPTFFNYVWLVLGLILLAAAIKAFVRGAIVAGIIWIVLALVVLSGLIGEVAELTGTDAPSALVIPDSQVPNTFETRSSAW